MASLIYKAILNQKINKFINAFISGSNSLFKRDSSLLHPGEYGKYREEIFKELLQMVINKDKSISDGFILTSDDDRSTQCDVIIYNTNTIPLIDEGIAKFYPIEEVNGVIEIKSKLSHDELKKALRKLAQIKLLGRKRQGILEKERVIFGEADDIITFLVCEKFNFKKNPDFKEIYEGIPRRYWHNGILSIEDGYWGYCMNYDKLPESMKMRIKQAGLVRTTNQKAWEYPVHIEDDKIYFCDYLFAKIDAVQPYRHIMKFIVSLQKALQFVNIYASDSITYLGFEIDHQKEIEEVEYLMRREKDVENTQIINEALHMSHRVKPYDINNISDIQEKLKMIVAEYLDYCHYWLEVANVLEHFDESMEYYDPSAWSNRKPSTKNGSNLMLKTYKSISDSCDCLYELFSTKEKECRNLLEAILKMDDETKIKVLGKAYPWHEVVFEDIFENITEVEYQYNIEESLKVFLQHIEIKFSEAELD